MAQKIGILVDCSGGLEWVDFKHNVKIARTTINFGEEVLTDGIDVTPDQFYDKVRNSEVIPSTSAPTMGEIITKLEEFKEEGYTDVIFFTISYGLSTYGSNVDQIKDSLVDDLNVHIVNSENACIMEGYQAYYADLLASKGYTVEQILELVKKMRDRTNAYFVVDDLKYLVKNGRLSGAAGFIGTLVNIKPILNLGVKTEGKIITFEKVRTKKRAVDQCIQHIQEEYKDYKNVIYFALHAGVEEEGKVAYEQMKNAMSNGEVKFSVITPTVGAHVGAGLLGFCAIPLDDLPEL